MNKNCLSYWFPLLSGAGVPVPETVIVRTDLDLYAWMDDEEPVDVEPFLNELQAAAHQIGDGSCFLRTGHTSAKFGWESTCYLSSLDNLLLHVAEIVEYSAIVSPAGLPTDVWAVRELLHTTAAFHAFDGLPITKERRYFLRDGEVETHHPYWISESMRDVTVPGWEEALNRINAEPDNEIEQLSAYCRQVGEVLPGYWSIDFIETSDRGWVAIDMALGEDSWRRGLHESSNELAWSLV
jgi:hypothetical protein